MLSALEMRFTTKRYTNQRSLLFKIYFGVRVSRTLDYPTINLNLDPR